ncbi:MAG: hypothetical protein COV08_01895 [Candidatus Vogelbacteria bacterium CG10_big_fil_rev_8_21_14_0_10_49_38]|uniref:ZIP family metal transporter n=1 Tax=Candidatus Vogelbacteria bacterium CG10_big_fil_rev_8_21_14_0_10_49_38 TaxID=1975043 RepID=A0A2H0RHU8_9BACT|nr:MAG: hypothetical protein BK006_01915 [bacterium CG10_49_38]PIR46006.1 MAG: hypothetical protein COV08_01895 [Candidatus Vogelbacteria bacterium CG10_big_fil_rev_8_21_14_0_10_49_38]
MLIVVWLSLLVMSASLIGVFAVWRRAGRLIEKNLAYLVSFAAGVFLVIAYKLAREAIEHADQATAGLGWILFGFGAVWLVFKLLPTFHHHCEDGDDHCHTPIDARRILISDGLHNIGDGILLAGALAVSNFLGLVTALSIFIHELVQEISEFFVLKQAGYSARRALTLNFLVSGTILFGSLGGYFLLDKFEALEAPLLGLAAGAFFNVVLHDLIPYSIRHSTNQKRYLKHLIWFAIGAGLNFGLNQLLGH